MKLLVGPFSLLPYFSSLPPSLSFVLPPSFRPIRRRRKLKFLQRYARSESIVCLSCNEYLVRDLSLSAGRVCGSLSVWLCNLCLSCLCFCLFFPLFKYLATTYGEIKMCVFFLKRYMLYKSTFYLLTYLLTYSLPALFFPTHLSPLLSLLPLWGPLKSS